MFQMFYAKVQMKQLPFVRDKFHVMIIKILIRFT